MSFLIIFIPFVAALALCRQLSFNAFFKQYGTGFYGKPVDSHFSPYIFAYFIVLRVEMFAIVFSVVGGLGCGIFFGNASYAEAVRVNFILSIIAVIVAILAAIFCRLAVLLQGLLYTLTHCVLMAVFIKCDIDEEEDKEIASEIGAFACFIMEDIFTLRVHLKMLSEVTRTIKPDADIDAFLARILSLFCGYLEDVRDERKREFIHRQPAYQLILDLNARI